MRTNRMLYNKVVYNILNVLCNMLYDMIYSSLENQCNNNNIIV